MFLLSRGFFFVFALCWCYSRFLVAFCLFGLNFQWFCCEFKIIFFFIVQILNAFLALRDRQYIRFVMCMLLHSLHCFPVQFLFPIFLKFKWNCLNSSDRLTWSHLLVFRRDGARKKFRIISRALLSQRWFRDSFFFFLPKKRRFKNSGNHSIEICMTVN